MGQGLSPLKSFTSFHLGLYSPYSRFPAAYLIFQTSNLTNLDVKMNDLIFKNLVHKSKPELELDKSVSKGNLELKCEYSHSGGLI